MAAERRDPTLPVGTIRRSGATVDDRPATRRAAAIVEAEQIGSEQDQTASDSDETAAAKDQVSADRDQQASDQDQATADRDSAAHPDQTAVDRASYARSQGEREAETIGRMGTRLERADSSRHRDASSTDRDDASARRDHVADERDATERADHVRIADLAPRAAKVEAALLKQLEDLAAQAAADRARAAVDRERAARDRAKARIERERLEAELRSAHLDDLTGAYRRDMGRMALSHEIDRARRTDGRFVVAFIDVDRLKDVNDRDGHAAGDRVLQSVVEAIRARLRSFDPIVRYGGDEFVCGLIGTDVKEAKRRFKTIEAAVRAVAGVGVSVGMAALKEGDTPEVLMDRADAAMLAVKARHHATDA